MRLVFFLCGCLSFHSVEVTAKMGDEVSSFRRALDPLPSLCRLSAATGTQPAAECMKLEADAAALRRIPEQIAAWSEALRCMAEDRGAPGVGNSINALAPAKLPIHLGAAVEALAHLITQSYRRSALKSSVRAAAPHIAQLVSYARAAVKLQRERVDLLSEQSQKIAGVLPEATPAQVAERLALADIAIWLDQERERLADYDKALAAFGAAHARLAAEAEKLGSADADVYFAILSDLKDLAGAWK
jgi:hypothetical protein